MNDIRATGPRLKGSEFVSSGRSRRLTLPGVIQKLHDQGKLPTPFGVEHLSALVQDIYAPAYLSVVLANYCESTGDYVQKGTAARFRRVSRGRYVVLKEPPGENQLAETNA